ncbi:MAG: PaaI family thioesterase [Sneathiella sp.]
MMLTTPPKEGFSLRGNPSPLTDPWEPIYSREETDTIDIGLWLREEHCNGRGFAHGGLISALADSCMGHSCYYAMGGKNHLVTVSLSVDFLGITRPGAWLEFKSEIVKTGRNLCFVQCTATADGVICARANATFKIV